MLRTPDVPTRKSKEFDPEEYEEEKLWIKRRMEGKIKTSTTPGGWKLVLGTAFIISLVIGAVVGGYISILIDSYLPLFGLFSLVFVISLYFLSSDFATVEIDPERKMILYDGTVNFAGEFRATRYRGSINVITGTQLMQFKLLFGRKSRPYIRFMTNSGYLRVNFDPRGEREFLQALDKTGLIDLERMENALNNKSVVKNTDIYNAYYIKKFDRSQYFAKLKQKREDEKNQEKIRKRIKRQELIEKSKKYTDSQTGKENSSETPEL